MMDWSQLHYDAVKNRDKSFDGRFFFGVKTTGIYCRPICPANPKSINIEFFKSKASAERAGYRPCKRCRPDSIPQSAAWTGKAAVVKRALKILNSQTEFEMNEDQFAERFGITARHLRRIFKDVTGKTPRQYFFESHLDQAKRQISETALPVSKIALSSGFYSIRRFNDAFKKRFKKSPTEIRKR